MSLVNKYSTYVDLEGKHIVLIDNNENEELYQLSYCDGVFKIKTQNSDLNDEQLQALDIELRNLNLKSNNTFPHDWEYPLWSTEDRIHCWRNYANEKLKTLWSELDSNQKQVISECLQEIADTEKWD